MDGESYDFGPAASWSLPITSMITIPSTCLMLHLAPKGNYVDTQHPWTRESLRLSVLGTRWLLHTKDKCANDGAGKTEMSRHSIVFCFQPSMCRITKGDCAKGKAGFPLFGRGSAPGKRPRTIKGSRKFKLFPSLSPDLITAARWLLVQHFTFGVRRAFRFLSYSHFSGFFFVFFKYSSLFCCLGCSPPGTLLVAAVGRGLFFLHFGLVKRIKITPARLSFTTAVKT